MFSLRQLALRGGAYLSLRSGLGVTINFGGIILLTRLIGPGNYGLYATALGITLFLFPVLLWGIEVYLVRHEGEEREEVYHQAFTLLLLLGTVGTLLALAGVPLLQWWVSLDGFVPVALAMFSSLPVFLLSRVPLGKLERALDYRKVAFSELTGVFAQYAVALPLAFAGLGVAAPVAGWWAHHGVMLVILYPAARYFPRLHWEGKLARDMVGYGLSFSPSTWIFKARELVNSLVVSRFLGAEAAGYVALAIQFVRGLSFVKEAMWRLSIAALARVREDRARMVRAVSEGMKLQVMALAPLLVGFAWVAPFILPYLSGRDWLPLMEVYPFIALGVLVNGVFNLHASALYVVRRNWKVTMFNLAHFLLFAVGAFVLVPRLGLVGYGWAEVVGLGGYALIHAGFAREFASPYYKLAALWGGAAALALFVPQLGWWAAAGIALVVLWPGTWREIGGYAKEMWRAREA